MKSKLWYIIYAVSVLAIEGVCLLLKVNINFYLWILTGFLFMMLFVSYGVLINGQQQRANFYLDKATGEEKDKLKIMPIEQVFDFDCSCCSRFNYKLYIGSITMLENGKNECSCHKKSCVRHGKCSECIEYHKNSKYLPYCKRENVISKIFKKK